MAPEAATSGCDLSDGLDAACPSSSRLSECVIRHPWLRPDVKVDLQEHRHAHQFPADGATRAGAAGNTLAVGMCRKKAQTTAEISPSNASP